MEIKQIHYKVEDLVLKKKIDITPIEFELLRDYICKI